MNRKYIKGLGALVEKELAIIIDAVFSSDIVRPFSSSRMEMSWRALVAASAASVIVGCILERIKSSANDGKVTFFALAASCKLDT